MLNSFTCPECQTQWLGESTEVTKKCCVRELDKLKAAMSGDGALGNALAIVAAASNGAATLGDALAAVCVAVAAEREACAKAAAAWADHEGTKYPPGQDGLARAAMKVASANIAAAIRARGEMKP